MEQQVSRVHMCSCCRSKPLLHPAAGTARSEASGEADRPALAEAAVTGLETVLPAPLPAEIKADAVDTDTWLNHCRMGASW